MNYTEQLEAILKKKGITKYKLSQMLGKKSSYVYDCFNGKRAFGIKQATAFAEAINCSITVTITENE
jgi:cyanate lyase